jgi:molybdate transport system substrate-binding protein
VRGAAIALSALLLASCGGSGSGGRLTVFAASSLTGVLQPLATDARFNFAGSDELATQLREGARADVYAAATTRYPRQLFEEGTVARPRVFATNRLVLVVPADNPAHVDSVRDLRRPGVKLVVAQRGVPAGDYTRSVLAERGELRVLDRVVSEEHDVKGVVGKIALGEADAGFGYATDARAAGSDVRAIDLPGAAAASVRYAVAVVHDAEHAEEAQKFVERLLGAPGRAALRRAGFGLP